VPNPYAVHHIVQYLRQNRDRYHRLALKQRLASDGFRLEDIEAAEAVVYSGQSMPQGLSEAAFALIMVGTILFNFLAIPAVAVLLISLLIDANADEWTYFLPLLSVALLPAEFLGALAIRPNRREVSNALLWAVGISVVPIGVLAALYGTCVAMLRSL
jgi:hypothetical protein